MNTHFMLYILIKNNCTAMYHVDIVVKSIGAFYLGQQLALAALLPIH